MINYESLRNYNYFFKFWIYLFQPMNKIGGSHNSNLNHFSLITLRNLETSLRALPGLLASSVSVLLFSSVLFWGERYQWSILEGVHLCAHVCVHTTDMLQCRLSLYGNCILIELLEQSSWSRLSARNSKLGRDLWPAGTYCSPAELWVAVLGLWVSVTPELARTDLIQLVKGLLTCEGKKNGTWC